MADYYTLLNERDGATEVADGSPALLQRAAGQALAAAAARLSAVTKRAESPAANDPAAVLAARATVGA